MFGLIRQTNFAEAVIIAKAAVEEIKRECFSSKTLKTLMCNQKFKTTKPNSVMAISSVNNEPIELSYNIASSNNGERCINIFSPTNEKLKFGNKTFSIKRTINGWKMKSGSMSSREETCKEQGIKGIGILEDKIQIAEALKMGIKSIPRLSVPDATLFHVRMGFLPKPELRRIRTQEHLQKILNSIKEYSSDLEDKHITPIIVCKRGIFGNKYYIDTNATQCLANIRAIKSRVGSDYSQARHLHMNSDFVDLELSGENLQKWKKLISGEGM